MEMKSAKKRREENIRRNIEFQRQIGLFYGILNAMKLLLYWWVILVSL